MRITLLLSGWVLVAGCVNVSLNDINLSLPTDDEQTTEPDEEPGEDPTSDTPDDDEIPTPGADEILLCVDNTADTSITYRVGEVSGAITPSALDPGTGECFSASCGVDVGIDLIQSETFSNPPGELFPGSQIPCGSVFRMMVQNDGSVQGFIDTNATP